MRLYGSSTLLWGYSFETICERFAKVGFEGVELWAEQFWREQFTIEGVTESVQRYQLELSMHAASWDLNLCSLNEGIRAQSILEIIRSMELAERLGVQSLTIHPGRLTVNYMWQQWHVEQLQRSLDELESLANRMELTLSIEMMEVVKKELITTPQLLNELVDHRSNHMATTFDVAHIPLSESPVEMMKALHRIDKVHLSDSTLTTFHVPLGEGAIELANVFNELEKIEMPIVIEGLDYLGEKNMLERNVAYLRNHSLFGKRRMRV